VIQAAAIPGVRPSRRAPIHAVRATLALAASTLGRRAEISLVAPRSHAVAATAQYERSGLSAYGFPCSLGSSQSPDSSISRAMKSQRGSDPQSG
jgi:hypothetical protein